MKNIIISVTFAVMIFIGSNVFAQGNNQPAFQADVNLVTQYDCPQEGTMHGYVPLIGHAYKDFDTFGHNNLLWDGGFPGYQPCTVEATTVTNEEGEYCYGTKTKDLSLYDNDITVNLLLVMPAGNGNTDPD